MNQKIVALTGISGVGKSTFLQKLSQSLDFFPLEASRIILEARKNISFDIVHDTLRYANLSENQELFIKGLKSPRLASIPLMIIDGHSLIEQDTGYSLVDPSVFLSANISAMIFLHDDPSSIFRRRLTDTKRNRPRKSVEQLDHIQGVALSHSKLICKLIKVPLLIAQPEDFTSVANHLPNLLQR